MNRCRYSKSLGNAGEQLVQNALRSRGFLLPERIATPVKITPPRNQKLAAMNLYHVAWSDPVSGDHRAVLPNGASVLVESKTYLNQERLQFSKLRKGQPENLSAHAAIPGAVSLLAWVGDLGVVLMRWPVPDFVARTSLALERAFSLNITDVKYLRELGGEM